MDPEALPLRDLHLPEPVGWWPPAPGWWLLMALAAGLVSWFLWRSLAAWRRSRPRRLALAEFRRAAGDYARNGDVTSLARRLSALLRRAMLAYAPRAQVAGLTGADWLRYLDRGLPEPLFSAGPGRALVRLPYCGRPGPGDGEDAADAAGLMAAVRARLQTPLPEERR